MPHGEHDIAAANGLGAGKHGIRRDTRQALVNQVLVRVSATQCARIRSPGIAVGRLHEYKGTCRPAPVVWLGHVKRPIEQPCRPCVADALQGVDGIFNLCDVRRLRRGSGLLALSRRECLESVGSHIQRDRTYGGLRG